MLSNGNHPRLREQAYQRLSPIHLHLPANCGSFTALTLRDSICRNFDLFNSLLNTFATFSSLEELELDNVCFTQADENRSRQKAAVGPFSSPLIGVRISWPKHL